MKRFITVAHLILLLLVYTSPWWLDWKLVAVGFVLNYLQLKIYGRCMLTGLHIDDKNMSFHQWLLTKLGFRINPNKLNYVLRNIIPYAILVLAIFLQETWKVKPLINL